MNAVLDSLFLRRPLLDYVSPAICEAQFSSSGSSSIFLEPLPGLYAPTGPLYGGVGRNFLRWGLTRGEICFSIWKQVDPSNPNSPYNLVAGCIPAGSIAVCSAGYYEVSAITPTGETPKSQPFLVTGLEPYVVLPLPSYPGATGYNVYKNPDITNVNGTYTLYYANANGDIFELCADGCYKMSAITLDGETPLSDANCSTCPPGYYLDDVTGTCKNNTCWYPAPCGVGYHWDAFNCICSANGGGGGATTEFDVCTNDPFGETFVAPGHFGAPCVFTMNGSLPPGVTFQQDSALTASVSGSPTLAGTYYFSVHIHDNGDQQQSRNYSIVVTDCVTGPDWTTLVWDNIGTNRGYVTAVGAVFNGSASGLGGDDGYVQAHASLTYTGPSIQCKITLLNIVTNSPPNFAGEQAVHTGNLRFLYSGVANGNVLAWMFQDGIRVPMDSFDAATNTWKFTLAPSVNSLIEFTQPGYNVIGASGAGQGYGNTNIAVRLTFANV